MAYATNPNLPRVRMDAVALVRQGWSVRAVARHFGYTHSAVVKWVARAPEDERMVIPTRSSRPYHHPDTLPSEIVSRILALRAERNQCAEIIHWRLVQEGIAISLSSIKRTLKRNGLSRFSRWKKWHQYPERPMAEKPGILVEIDSMHDGPPQDRLSAYALIDVHSRWAWAEATERVNSLRSVRFVARAHDSAPFPFVTVQSDHGSEFAKWFTKTIEHRGMRHRHSRVRMPTDNSHVERFIQTLQRECLNHIPKTLRSWQKEIPEYIRYYNEERPHMGLNMKTPADIIKTVPSY